MPPKTRYGNTNKHNCIETSNKRVSDYFPAAKRASLPMLVTAHKNIDNNQKESEYYITKTPSLKQQPTSNVFTSKRSSVENKVNITTKRRDSKRPLEIETPQRITRQTPFFNNQATPKVVQQQQPKQSIQQQNQFFKVPFPNFANTRGNTQQGSACLQKSTNYTISTDATSKKQTQALQSIGTNKRQNAKREIEEIDTPFDLGAVLEKRQARFSNPLAPASTQRRFKTVDKIYLEDSKAKILTFNVVQDEVVFPQIYQQNSPLALYNPNFFAKQKECDYDTDLESIQRAKQILQQDLVDSLDFLIKKDPLLLVNNF